MDRWFFANFFRLLLAAISVSEAAVLGWFLVEHRVLSLPALVPVGLGIHAVNLVLAARMRRRNPSNNPAACLPRLYYAVAFTSLFCFGFLLLSGLAWLAVKTALGATVEARPMSLHLVAGSDVDTAFRWLTDAGMAVIAFTFAYGYSIGQLRLKTVRLTLPISKVRSGLDGLRIVQLSDIHIGLNLERAQLEGFVAQVNDLRPDLICITGDIVDGPLADVSTFFPVLGGLRAAHGVFAILGNHDHYADADLIEAALRQLTPFTVLRDAQAVVTVGGERLHVIGLDDRGRDWGRGVWAVQYLETALPAIPPDEPVLLLSHRPDVFRQAAANGVALMLSGHTHGGQIALPWFNGRTRNLAQFVTPYDRGLYERDGSYLYVNCGLGVTGQRIRLCTPREITVIELRAGRAFEADAGHEAGDAARA